MTAGVDPYVDFDWDYDEPAAGVGEETFSVRWSGLIQATHNGDFTFYTYTDDGVRLWVNGVQLVNEWNDHTPTEHSGTITLVAGQLYDIRMEYYDNTANAVAQLWWSHDLIPKEVIPAVRLFFTRFDLDVNNNGAIGDVGVDGVRNYLPGYEENTPKVSTGTGFNEPQFAGQQMCLVLDGIGTDLSWVTKVVFKITTVTSHPGYASNRSNAIVEATTEDYAFHNPTGAVVLHQPEYTITRDSVPSDQDPGNVHGGDMEATNTWVYFYCKDYGGSATVTATIYFKTPSGGPDVMLPPITIKVPLDDDADGIADKWETQMANRWLAQYGPSALGELATIAEARALLTATADAEMKDPDRAGALVEQKDVGDAHTVFEEYRGYILDGGSGHAGGHIRLDPARKEILVEVDHAGTLESLPDVPGVPAANQTLNGRLKHVLNGAGSVFSHATRGTGIAMYYLFDEPNLNLPKDQVDTQGECEDQLKLHRNAALASDFLHFLFINETDTRPQPQGLGSAAFSFDPIPENDTVNRNYAGSVLATKDLAIMLPPGIYPKQDELYSCTIAHELTHLLIDRRSTPQVVDPEFDEGEHTKDPDKSDLPGLPKDRYCLMFGSSDRLNREFETVKFFPIVQGEIATRTNATFGSS